ncbi:MAG: hypothetical protein WC648_04915 [Candidatus Paceibacterota bacterium]
MSFRSVLLLVLVLAALVGQASAGSWSSNGSTSPAWQNTSGDAVIRGNGYITNDLAVLGYLSWWDFLEGSGTTAHDVNKTTANDCILTNATFLSGGGLNFSGATYTGSWIATCEATKNLNISSIYTSFETTVDPSNTYYPAIFYQRNASYNDFGIYVNGVNSDRFTVAKSTYTITNPVTEVSGAISTAGIIHRRLSVFNESNSTFDVFNHTGLELNLSYTIQTKGNGSYVDHSVPISFGNMIGGARGWVGYIYEVIIYDYQLNSSEILSVAQRLYKSSNNRTFFYDFGSGRQGSQVMINFTNTTNATFVELWNSATNFTSDSGTLITNNVTNATWINLTTKVQTQAVRLVLKGNTTLTSKIIEVSLSDEESTIVQVLDNDTSTFWVRTDGSDSCNGQNNMSYAQNSTDCAWANTSKATNMMAGQTTYVLPGIYFSTYKLGSTKNGNLTHPIRLLATDPTKNATILDGNWGTGGAIYLNQNHDIIIDGFTLRNYSYLSDGDQPLYTYTSGTILKNITLRNITIYDAAVSTYFRSPANSQNVTIDNLEMWNTTGMETAAAGNGMANSRFSNIYLHGLITDTIGINVDSDYSTWTNVTIDGIATAGLSKCISTGEGDGIVFDNLTIRNCGTRGFRVGTGVQSNLTIKNSIIDTAGVPLQMYADTELTMINTSFLQGNWDNQGPAYLKIYNSTLSGMTFSLYGMSEGSAAKNSVDTFIFQNNTVINSSFKLSNINDSTIINNKFINGIDDGTNAHDYAGIVLDHSAQSVNQVGSVNMSIQSNVFYNLTNGIYVHSLLWTENLTAKNNIFLNITRAINNATGGMINSSTVSYNMVYNNSSVAYVNILDTNTISGSNPLFNDTSINDFHLKSTTNRWNGSAWVQDIVTSPAIGAGDPTSDNSLSPWGGVIEMGAYGNTAEASQGTPLGCGTLSEDGEIYTLTQSVTSTGTCFTIGANNITLTSNSPSNQINFSTTEQGYGVYNNNYSNVTVKNLNITTVNTSATTYDIYYFGTNAKGNVSGNTLTGNGWRSIILSSSSNNTLDNNTAGKVIKLLFSNNNVLTNNTLTSGIDLSTAFNNNVSGGSISSSTGNSYSLNDSYNNVFIDTNFTTRRVYITGPPYIAWFNYSNNGGLTWVSSNTSTGRVILRTIINWNQTNITYDENTTFSTATSHYNVSGLVQNVNYNVYVDSVLNYSLTSDASGVLPLFSVPLTTTIKSIKVLQENATVAAGFTKTEWLWWE